MMNKKIMALMLGTAMTLSSASDLMVSASTTQMASQVTTQKAASSEASNKTSGTENKAVDTKKENDEIWGRVTKVDKESIEIAVGTLGDKKETSAAKSQDATKTESKNNANAAKGNEAGAGEQIMKLTGKNETIAIGSDMKLQREKKEDKTSSGSTAKADNKAAADKKTEAKTNDTKTDTSKSDAAKSELETIKLADIKVGDVVKVTYNSDKKPVEITVVSSVKVEEADSAKKEATTEAGKDTSKDTSNAGKNTDSKKTKG